MTTSQSRTKREGENSMVSADSRTWREKKRTYRKNTDTQGRPQSWPGALRSCHRRRERTYKRQGCRWDGGRVKETRDLEDSNTKNQPGPKSTVGKSPKATPQSRHLVRLIVFSLALGLHPSPPLPHVKCESEGSFFRHFHARAL